MLEFFGDYDIVALITVIIGSAGAFITWFVTKWVRKKAIPFIIYWITQVVSKLFGDEHVEGLEDDIKALPFIKSLQIVEDENRLLFETKLIELKIKLVSPTLTLAERVAFSAEYDLIMNRIGHMLSETLKDTLAKIEEAAKKVTDF